jgi:hypothetical protein
MLKEALLPWKINVTLSEGVTYDRQFAVLLQQLLLSTFCF